MNLVCCTQISCSFHWERSQTESLPPEYVCKTKQKNWFDESKKKEKNLLHKLVFPWQNFAPLAINIHQKDCKKFIYRKFGLSEVVLWLEIGVYLAPRLRRLSPAKVLQLRRLPKNKTILIWWLLFKFNTFSFLLWFTLLQNQWQQYKLIHNTWTKLKIPPKYRSVVVMFWHTLQGILVFIAWKN